ncbi:MAG: nucleoside-diphosphate kinase [Chlamydiae bacterium RIFCSPHIGHO2_02_FULL_49_29]|nr:MAG: nucleoside-diphosphate kinase [Chlamydiae bacterium RIFCSPHIGHO2_02_FULL_49_29]
MQQNNGNIDKTLVFLKPDVFEKNCIGKVIEQFEKNHFDVIAIKILKLSRAQAEEFYAVHRGKPFYDDLVSYVTRGNIAPIILKSKKGLVGEELISAVRSLMGATNPPQAEKGTIRQLFGESMDANVLHGSDSPENAFIEMRFFFPIYALIK